MTAQSSSKSLFGTYLKYRLGLLKNNLVMCCILNVLALPLYALAAMNGFGGAVSEFVMFGRIFSIMCIASLPAIAIMNAAAAFDYHSKKDLTDTIGVLPLNHKQRFFADLLAGYIVSAAPLIPCGIFCAAAVGGTQATLEDFYEIAGGACNFRMATVGIVIVVSLFLIVSFAYLFSVLINTCCGKLFHSVIFSVIGMAVLPLFIGGIVRCFANGMVGVDPEKYFSKAVAFFPPIGLFGDLFGAMNVAFDRYIDPLSRAEELYAVCDPVHIVFYVILAAGVIAGAYYLGKRRLAEDTGSAFAIKPMFFVLCAGITAAATIMTLSLTYHTAVRVYLIISAAVGAVTCFVTLLLNPMKKKKLLRSAAFGAEMILLMIAVWVLLDKTGSLGARYLPKNADNIEYIRINDTYTITDKADVEKYVSLLNTNLRDYSDDMYYREDGFCVEIKKTDGRTIERRYEYSRDKAYYNATYYAKNMSFFEKTMKELDGYVDYFFDELGDASDNWTCYVKTNTAAVDIPANKTKEFIAILREEASEKYFPNAEPFADVEIYAPNGVRTFEIKRDFVETIKFLEDLDNDVEIDPDSPYLEIRYNTGDGKRQWLYVTITYKDRENDNVKELISLLEEHRGKVDGDFEITSFFASDKLYVSSDNRARILELMYEMAEARITAGE